MKILVSGSTGLVGARLVAEFDGDGREVVRLVRRSPSGANEVEWNPAAGVLKAEEIEGCDAVIHLAGENVGSSRWTARKKTAIRESRVNGTKLLADTLAGLNSPPKVFVSASAIGFYGDRGDERLSEESAPGEGFLADVCRAWEATTQPAQERGIRVVHARLGVVLSPDGGALQKMLTPFRMGVGGVLGDGSQYMSWISLDDVIAALRFLVDTEALSGPVNCVAPVAVSNREFTKALGKVLGRPTIFPMPKLAARLAFGEMADALLLASVRVEPTRLLQNNYRFLHTELGAAFRHLLGSNA